MEETECAKACLGGVTVRLAYNKRERDFCFCGGARARERKKSFVGLEGLTLVAGVSRRFLPSSSLRLNSHDIAFVKQCRGILFFFRDNLPLVNAIQ